MGWWGMGVMEGDAPSEAAAVIQETLVGLDALEADYEEALKRVNEALQDPAKVRDLAATIPQDGVYRDFEYLQALGFMVIEAGGALSVIKDKVLAAIDADEWAKNNQHRNAVMKKFRRIAVAYVDGQPRSLESKGLIETMLEAVPTRKGSRKAQ